MTGGRPRSTPARVRLNHVEYVYERLSPRDWLVIETVDRLRLVTTHQLDRLLFSDLSGHSQAVTRGRVVRRLISWRVLTALPRRVGGSERGSAATVVTLDSTGRQLLRERQAVSGTALGHAPGLPSARTVRHGVAVAELYTSLIEHSRMNGGVTMTSFSIEPASWWPNGLGNYMKPDAYVLLEAAGRRDHWWCEVDLATESIPTLKRKALAYLDFYGRGQLGPSGVMPWVVFSVPSAQRRDAVLRMIDHLPEPAADLFFVCLDRKTAFALLSALRE